MRLRPFELEIEPRLDENVPFHPRYATIGYYASTAADELHVISMREADSDETLLFFSNLR